MRRRYRLAAISLAIPIGVVAILLGHDVRAWRNVLEDDGALQYATTSSEQLRLTAPTLLPSALSGGLLTVGRDRQWLEAMQKFTVAYQDTLTLDALGAPSYKLLHQGETALNTVTRDPDPTRASQAFDLLGVLVFREALPGSGIDTALLQQSVTDLQNAVRLDESNERAKENLELTLRVLIAEKSLKQKGHAAANHPTTKRKGAYGGPPGEGY